MRKKKVMNVHQRGGGNYKKYMGKRSDGQDKVGKSRFSRGGGGKRESQDDLKRESDTHFTREAVGETRRERKRTT